MCKNIGKYVRVKEISVKEVLIWIYYELWCIRLFSIYNQAMEWPYKKLINKRIYIGTNGQHRKCNYSVDYIEKIIYALR